MPMSLIETKRNVLNLKKRDIRSHTESEKMLYRLQKAFALKAGEFPVPAILYLGVQEQADTCFQQQGRQQFGSGHSDHGSTEKRSEEHEASDSSSNLQNESVFFSAVQELAKMSPPPSVPRPKYSLLDAGSHGRSTVCFLPRVFLFSMLLHLDMNIHILE